MRPVILVCTEIPSLLGPQTLFYWMPWSCFTEAALKLRADMTCGPHWRGPHSCQDCRQEGGAVGSMKVASATHQSVHLVSSMRCAKPLRVAVSCKHTGSFYLLWWSCSPLCLHWMFTGHLVSTRCPHHSNIYDTVSFSTPKQMIPL